MKDWLKEIKKVEIIQILTVSLLLGLMLGNIVPNIQTGVS